MKGEYRHLIDGKGRLAIPAKFREELGERFTVTRGMEGCLIAYPEESWEKLEQKINAKTGKDGRRVQRFFYSSALDAELDSQGRILVPANLREFAGLQKEVCVIGVSDHAEIWDMKKWDEYNDALDDGSIEELMEME